MLQIFQNWGIKCYWKTMHFLSWRFYNYEKENIDIDLRR